MPFPPHFGPSYSLPKLTLRDLRPFCNGWTKDTTGIRVDFSEDSQCMAVCRKLSIERCASAFCKKGEPLFIEDTSTNNLYLNIPKDRLRRDYFRQALFTPLSFPWSLVMVPLVNIFRVVSFYHFRNPHRKHLTHADKFKNTAADIARIVTSPLNLCGTSPFCTLRSRLST